MRFRFSDDQHEFAAALRQLLDRHFTAGDLRRVWESGSGDDPALWRQLADLGVLATMVPESDGGLGGDLVDAVLLIEQLGRAGAAGPVLETMTVGAVALAGSAWSRQLASGDVSVTAALLDEPLLPHRGAQLVLVSDGGQVRLVPVADLSPIAAESLDGGRLLGELVASSGLGVGIDADLEVLRDLGAVAASAFLLGLSSRMIELAAEYARNRRQFGQPIGAFQAVKHLLADALLAVEFARPAVYHAAWSFASDQPTRSRDASMAKCLASEAAGRTARTALQVHGAIGYTWECDLHLYMKKAWALSNAWGGAAWHRRRVGNLVL